MAAKPLMTNQKSTKMFDLFEITVHPFKSVLGQHLSINN